MTSIRIIQTTGDETNKAQEQFNKQCEMTEYLFSQTLLKRLETCKTAAERTDAVCNWFQSLRTMTVGNFLTTGLGNTFKVERS